MIEILKMQAVGKDGNFAIMYFDFLFQNMNELPNIVYRLGNVTYVVADGSTAIHKENHSLYKYNNRKWFKVATTTLPEIPNPDYVDSNGKHNIPNNEIHGYRTLDVSVAGGGSGFAPTQEQLDAMNSGIDSEKVEQIETNKNNILSEQAKTTGMSEGGSNYITVGGIRVYVSATAPTGARTGDLWIGG